MSALYLVKAGDPALRAREVQTLVDELLGGEDRTLVVEEFTVPAKTRGGGEPTTTRRRPTKARRRSRSSRRS